MLEINAGAGGVDSMDWSEMLFEMYTKWAQKNHFEFEMQDVTRGKIAGIKSVSVRVSGTNAYGMVV